MKKIIIVIITAGMSVGLLIGGVGNIGNVFSKASTTHSPNAATTCTIEPCSMRDIMLNRICSPSLCGQGSAKVKTLQAELNDLDIQNDLSEIQCLLGKLSILLGEQNSSIDADTQTIAEISQNNANTIQQDYEFQNILYIADTE